MAANAGEAAASIETPSGGAALHGIGETFVPEVQMGTANRPIPLSLPPGRHGIEPRLALSYSSGAGNGPCSMGWSIGPGISALIWVGTGLARAFGGFEKGRRCNGK